MYAKIEDMVTHRVTIGMGTNKDFYLSIGMSTMEVERSDVDGGWYEKNFAPMKSEIVKHKEQTVARISELLSYLTSTDWYCARYVDTGVDIPAEVKERRASARIEIDKLRAEIEILAQCTENVPIDVEHP